MIIPVLFGFLIFAVTTWLVFLPSGLLIFPHGNIKPEKEVPLWELIDRSEEFDG